MKFSRCDLRETWTFQITCWQSQSLRMSNMRFCDLAKTKFCFEKTYLVY